MLRTSLLAIVVLAVFVPAAVADVRTIATAGYGFDGPRLAGDEIIWSQPLGRELVTFADGPAGRRELDRQDADAGPDTVSPARQAAMDADASRVALVSYAMGCPGDEACKYGVPYAINHVLRTGPVAGPLATTEWPCGLGVVVAVGGGATACESPGEAVVIEGDGTVRRYEQARAFAPARPSVRLAGELVAIRTEPAARPGVRVLRRTTGEELLRVEERIQFFDLGPDGTIAYLLEDGTPAWSRPGAPEVHPLPRQERIVDLVLAGDRVAVHATTEVTRYTEQQIDSRYTVVDLAGRTVGAHAANATTGSVDFDGRRLVYGRRACRYGAIHVWDVDAPAPDELGPAGCVLPEPAARRLRVSRNRLVRVTLRCAPPPEAAACMSGVALTFRWRDRRGRVRSQHHGPYRYVDLDRGERRTLTIRLRRHELRHLRGARLEVRVARGMRARRHRLPLRLPRRRL